jgi:hypothetical protein
MVLEQGEPDSRWTAIASIAEKIACTAERCGSECARSSVVPANGVKDNAAARYVHLSPARRRAAVDTLSGLPPVPSARGQRMVESEPVARSQAREMPG